jgi:hypothetical protein
MVPINYSNWAKVESGRLRENRHFYFLGPIWKVSIAGVRKFIFTTHRPMTDKLLNTDYGNEPLGCIKGAGFPVHLSDYPLLCSYYNGSRLPFCSVTWLPRSSIFSSCLPWGKCTSSPAMSELISPLTLRVLWCWHLPGKKESTCMKLSRHR